MTTQVTKSKAKEAIRKAKTRLLLDNAYFGRLAMQFSYNEANIPTVATDGENIFYNPEFVCECADNKTLQGVLMHEVLHVALLHPGRRVHRQPMVWNIACDFVTNDILMDSGIKLPKGSLYDMQYTDMNAEEVYKQLDKNLKPKDPPDGDDKNGQGSGSGKQGAGGDIPKKQEWGEHDKWKEAQDPERWKKEARERKRQVKGSAPAAMKREWDKVIGNSQNWRVALARYLESAPIDYSFVPPDRRFSDGDIMLPDFREENLEDVVVAIDTSGSIDRNMLSVFMAELRAIMASYPCLTGHFCYCDTMIYSWMKFSYDTKLPEPQGFGGTDFVPVFKRVESENLRPSVLIYFTDGAGYFPDKPPQYPVIWALFGEDYAHSSIPFGTKLKIKDGGGE